MRKIPMNMVVSPDLKEYIQKESESLGMSASAFITMVVNQYRQQNEAVSSMGKVLEQLESLKGKLPELNNK